MRHGKYDTATGRTIEFRQRNPGDLQRFVENLRLLKRVLTSRGVDNEQDLVRKRRVVLRHDAFDLPQLLHQVLLRMETTGSIDENEIRADAEPSFHRRVRHGRRVGALLVAYYLCFGTIGPDRQLIICCRAEGVGCSDDDTLAVGAGLCGKFPDRCRFPNAVHTDDKRHSRTGLCPDQSVVARSEDISHGTPHRSKRTVASGPAVLPFFERV